MKLIRHLFSSFSNYLVNFLFPKSDLIHKLELVDATELQALLMVHPEKTMPPLPGISSLFPYRDTTVHELIHEIKYASNRNLASKIAPPLYKKCSKLSQEKHVVLTFIPATQSRKEKRGFDQGSLILNALKEYDTSIHSKEEIQFKYERDLLKWTKRVQQQSLTESKAERLKNMEQALTCQKPNLIKGAAVIVLDDVCTTGATLYEAKRALEDSGALSIYLLTIAH